MDDQSSMQKAFLDQLYSAIEKNFENEHFGVDELAHEIGISRSQLHRKLRANNERSASQMIKEYRLQKALEMLQEKVATVSEISYRVGFSSPSYFNTCFHDYFGYSPGKVESKGAGNDHRKNKFLSKFVVASSAGIIIISVGLFFFIWSPNPADVSRRHSTEISIAIIPFKNLSKDEENMHFADGMTDDLLNQLSSVQGFVVKSRQSSERYRTSQKSTSQIGKELDVEYFIEGSVQRYNDKIRIIVQLIDVKKDDHFWAETYDRELKDIFTVQSEISQQIARELNTVLSPAEIKQIEKRPTENIDAYNLYQKGRYFWHRRTKEDLIKSIDYFNQAIELDPAYALAYAGLADTYYVSVWWGWIPKNEGFPKAKMFVQKALDLDPKLAEAYATQGSMDYMEFRWKECESKLKKALDLNPNYASGHQYYAEYLEVTRKSAEARKQINQALELNPLSIIIQMQSSAFYYRSGAYEKALEEGLKGYDLDPNRLEDRWRMFKTYRMLGMGEKAKEQLHKLWYSDSTSFKYVRISEDIYAKSGIEGLLRWATTMEENGTRTGAMEIAENYLLLGEKELALDWLEKAFESRPQTVPKINPNIHFDDLRSDPRFIVLLKKMNLGE